ncbi:VirD4-like conjugal transfer protein, CD1115 family, partial [Lactococcus carnosus]|uniref:VirD4-like conjugal transfer protein, CD1115 family n=1 Tax=Pseudolactococcus carnosus TaxID=2749961 RepID=UPI001FBA7685
FSKDAQMGLYNTNLSQEVKTNKNTLVVGLPGDGKTFTYVKPNLMQMHGTYVLTDPKGLLVHEVGAMFKKAGYKIKIFDLVNLENSDQFNVFQYMTNELDIDRITKAIVEGTKTSDNQGEDFWNKAKELLMRSLIGYLYFDSQLRDYIPNLSMVADMLRNLERENEKVSSPVEKMFEDLEREMPGNYAFAQWELFQNFKSETRSSVVAIASAEFSVFDHKQVTNLIEKDTMEIEKWITEKTIVFVALPEMDTAYRFLSATFFAVIFDKLIKLADDIMQGRNKAFKPEDVQHIRFILDEFANIGIISGFASFQSIIRSREMSVEVILQAMSQLDTSYKNTKKTIINNSAVMVYLGTNDMDTMKLFSDYAGNETINYTTSSRSYAKNGSSSLSSNIMTRKLYTPDEIRTISSKDALVLYAKEYPYVGEKMSVLLHPKHEELANHPSDENWYEYQRYMSDIDEWYENTLPDNITDLTDEFLELMTAV